MSDVSDEMLMAYVDGELSDADRNQVDNFVVRNPEAKRRLTAFASTQRALGGVLRDTINEPIPVRLLDTVFNAPLAVAAAPARAARSERVSFVAQLRSLLLPLTPAHAIGAIAALCLVGVVEGSQRSFGPRGQEASPLVMTAGGRMLAHGALLVGLETAASGVPVTFGGGEERGSLKAILTFKRLDGLNCRIYELDHASGLLANGVSCRNAMGQWSVEVHDGAGARKPAAGQIVPAGGSMPSIVDAAVDRMIAGDAYGHEDEEKLLKNHWRQ